MNDGTHKLFIEKRAVGSQPVGANAAPAAVNARGRKVKMGNAFVVRRVKERDEQHERGEHGPYKKVGGMEYRGGRFYL
jgi:hypothetical protein